MSYLHITNGDGAANTLKQSAVSGDVLPWRDPMHHGPFPAGLELDDLSIIRARYLAGPDADPARVVRDFQLRDAHLRAAGRYDHVVLWFEHDLLDQLQILQLLDWCAQADLGTTTIEMICVNSFPGRAAFRGIGELSADEMASLFPQREAVRDAAFDLAQAGWAAFRAGSPESLLRLLSEDLDPLPYLRAALVRHFEEYPSAATGLTRTETQLLSLVKAGVQGPVDLFLQNMALEDALYLGDWATYAQINRLCDAGLLECEQGVFQYPSFAVPKSTGFADQRLRLSKAGEAILSGAQDAFRVMKRDMWLGGVHLGSDGPLWTWDARAACLRVQGT